MKKKGLKILAMFMAVVFAFGIMAACATPEDVVVDEPAATTTDQQQADDTQQTDPDPDVGVQQQDLFGARLAGAGVVDTAYDPFPVFESFQQSPFLEGMDLPAVEDRLPKYPKVPNTIPANQVDLTVGQYGGELRTATADAIWNPNIWAMCNEPLLNTPGILGEQVTGNVLHYYETNDDYTEFTFYMREGMRWSDGEPVTTEDVRFTVESVYGNTDLTTVYPSWLASSAGTPAVFEVLDEYSFKLTYDEPFGGLLIRLAIRQWTGYADLIRPAHFLKNFHAEYTDEATAVSNAVARGHDVGDWITAYYAVEVGSWGTNDPGAVDYPMLGPWINVGQSSDGQITRFERNPYYWKVDQAGNQLPYIDTLTSRHVQNTDAVTMMMVAGETDFNIFETALNNMPLYMQHAAENDYKVIMSDWHVTPTDIYLNLSYQDEQWLDVVLDVRFRQAVNLAFNNDEVINTIYAGFARPSVIIDPTYDPMRAGELLDEMGMTIGPDGYRTYPNGDPFVIGLDYADRTPDMGMVGEYFVAFMDDIGIRVDMRTKELGLIDELKANNDIQATIIWTEIIWYNVGEWVFLDGMAIGYYQYYQSGGRVGVKPPDDIQQLFDYIDEAFWLPPEEALGVFGAYQDSWRENVWGLQFLQSVQQPIVANNKLMNIDIVQPTWGIGLVFGGEIFYFAD